MANTSGPAPWSDKFSAWRRSTKAQRNAGWNFATGWISPSMPSWEGRSKKPKMRTLVSSNGTTYQIPAGHYDAFLGFTRDFDGTELSETYKNTKKHANINTPADYIDFAFNISKSASKVIEQEGCGSIKTLWYNKTYELLKVEFTNNGAIVVFFRLPKEVAGELLALAASKVTQISPVDGTERHALGIRFWDLVRIRGTMHGSRYKFQYTQEGSSTGTIGRQYGSGKNLWVGKGEELTRSAKKEINKQLAEDTAMLNDYYNRFAEGKLTDITQEDLKELREKINASVNSRYNKMQQELLKDDNNLLKHDKMINVQKAVDILPQELIDEINASDSLNVSKLSEKYNLSQRQTRALDDINTSIFRREEVIKQRNEKKRAAQTWDRARLDEAIDTFYDDRADLFRSRYTSPAKQFDYMKSMGYIPANAIYKKE